MTSEKLSRTQTVAVALVISGGFVTFLSQLIMSPALPSVMNEFGITASTGQWLTSIFLLVNGVMVPVTAYLIDRFSSRQIYISAMCAFTIGSVVAAFSNGFAMIMAGRIIQAMGAGIMIPFLTVIVMLIFPKARRGFAMGIVGVVIGFAPAIGPTLAGWIVDIWGWRYIFILIAPLALILLILAVIKLENIGERREIKLDKFSVVLSTFGFGGLLYGFSAAGSNGWTSLITIISIAAGFAGIVLFVRRQLSISDPVLNLRILKNSFFSVSTILAAVISAGLTVGAVITPIFMQSVQGYSALYSGLLLLPGALCMVVMSPVSGNLFDRFGPRALSIIGLSILTAGTLMMSFLDVKSTFIYACVGYTMRMLGLSMTNMPINTWGLNMLPNKLIAHGNAINNTARQIGGALGTAILVTVMMTVMANSPLQEQYAVVQGIDAAFRGAGGLTAAALILTIIRVKGNSYVENY
jgi:EmrB/QacA subfamily drug resistance transporter